MLWHYFTKQKMSTDIFLKLTEFPIEVAGIKVDLMLLILAYVLTSQCHNIHKSTYSVAVGPLATLKNGGLRQGL